MPRSRSEISAGERIGPDTGICSVSSTLAILATSTSQHLHLPYTYGEPRRDNRLRVSLIYWWKGRDSNPRPRHDEPAASLKIGIIFNKLQKGARSDWHDEARPIPADLPHRTRVLAQPNSARRQERSNFPTRSGQQAASPDGRCAARDRASDAAPDPRASAWADRGPAAVPRLDHRPRRVPQDSRPQSSAKAPGRASRVQSEAWLAQRCWRAQLGKRHRSNTY